MRAAPAVSLSVRVPSAWGVVDAGLHAVAAAALAGWAVGHAGGSGKTAVLAASMAVVGVVWWIWRRDGRRAATGLAWDGQCWHLDDGQSNVPVVGSPRVVIDLGHWILLRLQIDGGGKRWLALSFEAAGTAWPALRRALHAESGARASASRGHEPGR